MACWDDPRLAVYGFQMFNTTLEKSGVNQQVRLKRIEQGI
jgi:hypothetical protein